MEFWGLPHLTRLEDTIGYQMNLRAVLCFFLSIHLYFTELDFNVLCTKVYNYVEAN